MKIISVKTTEELNKKRLEMENDYHNVRWDCQRADFYARNGRRVAVVMIK